MKLLFKRKSSPTPYYFQNFLQNFNIKPPHIIPAISLKKIYCRNNELSLAYYTRLKIVIEREFRKSGAE